MKYNVRKRNKNGTIYQIQGWNWIENKTPILRHSLEVKITKSTPIIDPFVWSLATIKGLIIGTNCGCKNLHDEFDNERVGNNETNKHKFCKQLIVAERVQVRIKYHLVKKPQLRANTFLNFDRLLFYNAYLNLFDILALLCRYLNLILEQPIKHRK